MRMFISMKLIRVDKENVLENIEKYFEQDYGVEVKYSKRVKTFTREENTLEEVEKFLDDCLCIERLKDYKNYIEQLNVDRERIADLVVDFENEDLSDYKKVVNFFCDVNEIIKKYNGTGALKLPAREVRDKLRESGYNNLERELVKDNEEYLKYNKNLKEMTINSDNEELVAKLLIGDSLSSLNNFNFLDPKTAQCFEIYKERFGVGIEEIKEEQPKQLKKVA